MVKYGAKMDGQLCIPYLHLLPTEIGTVLSQGEIANRRGVHVVTL